MEKEERSKLIEVVNQKQKEVEKFREVERTLNRVDENPSIDLEVKVMMQDGIIDVTMTSDETVQEMKDVVESLQRDSLRYKPREEVYFLDAVIRF